MSARWHVALPVATLLAIHLLTLVGGFLAPYSPTEQRRDHAWAPPSHLRFVDADAHFHLRPFVYPLIPASDQVGDYHEDQTQRCHLRFLVRGDEYRLLGILPTDLHLLGIDPPARLYLLGTDGVGRDLLARVLVGGRISLFAGLLAGGIAVALGTLLGGAAGYLGGKSDALLMRTVELFLALPWLYLLLALRAFLPLELSSFQAFLILFSTVGVLGWARPARIVRGVVLSARERLFVTVSRGFGATTPHLLRHHLLPQTLSPLATQAAILVPGYVLAEIVLSFLGLGISEPHASWGNLFAELNKYHVLTNYRWMLAPAIPLFATFLSYYAVARVAPTIR